MAIKVEYIGIDSIKPYANNARKHEEKDIKAIIKSIEEFGFNDPIGVWHGEIVEGHGRLMAAKELGMTEIPIIRLDDLTDEQRRAYALAHNKIAELSSWYEEVLDAELLDIAEIDMSAFGFDMKNLQAPNLFERSEKDYDNRQDGNDEYNEFLDKFEIAKTTDDCYTPDLVYDAVAEWVENEYKADRKNFVRPFYPGGDYQNEKYKKTDIVVDNPPFSILSEILQFYTEKGVRFFLFAPALTLFSSSSSSTCAIGVGAGIVYENKANVSTSFLTNLETEYRFRTAPTLHKAIQDAVEKIKAENSVELAKNNFPNEVVTSTKLSYFSKYGIDFKVKREETERIRCLDAQKEVKQAIFGSGYLISEKAAAEKAAAEKAAAEKAAATVWKLSDREKEIVKNLVITHDAKAVEKQN